MSFDSIFEKGSNIIEKGSNIIEKGTSISSSIPPFMSSKIKDILRKDGREDPTHFYSKDQIKFYEFLINAKREIDIIHLNLNQIISVNYITLFRNLLKSGILIRVLLPDPKLTFINEIQQLTDINNFENNLLLTLSDLCNMKIISLNQKELSSFELKTFTTIPTYNMILLDKYNEQDAIMLVEPLLYGSSSKRVIEITRKKNRDTFEMYLNSFKKLWDSSSEYSCEWELLKMQSQQENTRI